MMDYKQNALNTIFRQSEAVRKLADYLNEDFNLAIEKILNCSGRVVLSGVGKSAIIAQKIASTLNSTGTPSLYVHSADAVHGDLGAITKKDIVIILSKSGNTPEIEKLTTFLKDNCSCIIAICGNPDSFLVNKADIFLSSFVERETCPNNLAPTSSTTAQLVIGDALADTLQIARGFSKQDFAKFHPGGNLGKKLCMKCEDFLALHQKPQVFSGASVREAIIEISSKRLGMTAVLSQNNMLLGVITDGDIRRLLEKFENKSIKDLKVDEIMTKNPKTIQKEALATQALSVMQELKITQLLVFDKNDYVGVIHLHDIIKEGI